VNTIAAKFVADLTVISVNTESAEFASGIWLIRALFPVLERQAGKNRFSEIVRNSRKEVS